MDSRPRLTILTLFPGLVRAYLSTSIVGKSVNAARITAEVIDIRDYATDKHRSCDDAPYGGGSGMIMTTGPLAAALDAVDGRDRHVVFPTPSGARFDQECARRLARQSDLVFVCGRYEGIDQRVVDEYVDDELSIGDYVLASGELATMVIVDALHRLIDGVLSPEATRNESFQDGLLEEPQYTRPRVFRGLEVPPVLLSGNHADIERWRREQRVRRTARRRPDLIEQVDLTREERAMATRVIAEGAEDGSYKGGGDTATQTGR